MASLCRAPAQEEIESYDDAITGAVPTGTNAASHDFDNDTDDSATDSTGRDSSGKRAVRPPPADAPLPSDHGLLVLKG